MKVLSLFDGMSCGRIALDQLGVPVEKYYASEIDKYAIQVSQANYPDIVQVGDICNLDPEDYKDIDLMIAGSPCQGFSFAGKQLAFDDPRSALFFEFIRLLKEIKPKYFLLENVRMKKEFLQVISQQVSECYPEIAFGIEPIFINSSLLSAQSRQRFYWTNIPGIQEPEDQGIVLRDILEDNPENEFYYSKKSRDYMERGNEKWQQAGKRRADRYEQSADKEKSFTITANWHKGVPYNYFKETKPKQIGIATDINGHDILKRVYSPDGKSPTVNTCQGGNREPKVVTGGAFRGRAYDNKGKRMDRDGSSVANKTTQMLELRKDDKSNAITTVGKDSVVVEESKLREKSKTVRSGGRGSYDRHEWDSVDELHWRKLTPKECERLQTVPDDYTNHVSNSQRYKMLGNGWTVAVIKHIFQNMDYEGN
jgi:DNA-cytosine methyltransferase